eukprot:TRINITY_DN9262_c0_g1_i1.p1 TRINITY_DN9262_c0_g1~~TRINITY_DN9262_c0_g1_i1.p1  ORF type:complete len:170 (-),score=24.04 TRINITY_DN9262_c0_g1_i1:57-536(-)
MVDVTWAFACIWTTIRIFDIHSKIWMSLISAFFTSIVIYLIYYLTFIKFDYGFNINVALTLAGWQSALWLIWGFKNLSSTSTSSKKKKMARSIVYVQCLTWLAGLLEVFDFPPILFDLLDGHAMWHGVTIYLGMVLWQFLIEDSISNAERISEVDHKLA